MILISEEKNLRDGALTRIWFDESNWNQFWAAVKASATVSAFLSALPDRKAEKYTAAYFANIKGQAALSTKARLVAGKWTDAQADKIIAEAASTAQVLE